jgi:hypothetical protein
MRAVSIVGLAELVEHLAARESESGRLAAVRAYRDRYGVAGIASP